MSLNLMSALIKRYIFLILHRSTSSIVQISMKYRVKNYCQRDYSFNIIIKLLKSVRFNIKLFYES